MKIRNRLALILPLVFVLFIVSSCQEQGNPVSIADDTEVQKLGYISNFNIAGMNFDFDAIEWITLDDTNRIKELNLDPNNDMPGGFYIHNPNLDKQGYEVSDNTEYQIINWDQNGELTEIDTGGFVDHVSGFYEHKLLCWITIDNGYVINVVEQYVP